MNEPTGHSNQDLNEAHDRYVSSMNKLHPRDRDRINGMENTLDQHVGEYITVENQSYHEKRRHAANFCMNGKLEARGDTETGTGGAYYLHVKECYNGSYGVTFTAARVERIEKMLSGRWVVTLKG